MSNSMTLMRFFLQAMWRGVNPLRARAFTSALWSSNNLAILTCPQCAATCNAVKKSHVVWSTSLGEWYKRMRAASTWSPCAAMCSAVRPFLVLAFIGAWRAINKSTTWSWPDRAAQCNGVRPSRVFTSILAPLSRRRFTLFALPHFVATCSGVMFC